jgi:hypothetical protein
VFPVCRVIVGASGSPGSIRALRFAEDLDRHNASAELVPVLAWTPPGGELAGRRAPCPPMRRIWREAAAERLSDALGAAWAGAVTGLPVRPPTMARETGHGLRAWRFRHRELTLDQVLHDWDNSAA